jgi:hypothetical protein
MAKQSGIIKLRGALDGIVFVRTKDGNFAKVRSGSLKRKMATDPKYQRTRENMNEFKAAGKAAGLVKLPFAGLLARNADTYCAGRLTKLMMAFIKLDSTSDRGERTPGRALASPSVQAMLENFNFNINAKLQAVLYNLPTVNVNSGIISLANFNAQKDLALPANTTHVSLSGAWAKIDLDAGQWEVQLTNVINMPIGNTTNNVALTPAALPTQAGLNLFVLKVEFFEEVNGQQYSLMNGINNPVSIIKVS